MITLHRTLNDCDFAEFGFAPAASAGGYFEACGVVQDFQLAGVGGRERQGRRRIRGELAGSGSVSQQLDQFGMQSPLV